MAAEQYCLKWNNHQSTLLVNFEALLESNALTDCTLSADGKYLDVHRVVLSACSPYFYKLFGEHREKHPIFFMKDVLYDELKGIVDYMYKGEVNIDQDKIESFLSVAKSLQIKGLADEDSGSAAKEDDEGLPRSKRKPPDLDSPLPDEAPRSPKRKRRPRPASQESADQNNHCDTYQQPAPQPEITMPTPMIPVKKTEPLETHSGYPQVQLKTEQIDEPQDDVQDLTLDDDEEEYGGEETQPGTSFSESSQDMKWFQQMTNQSASLGDESFMATASTQQNVSNNTGTPGAQGRNKWNSNFQCIRCNKYFKTPYSLDFHIKYTCGVLPRFQCDWCGIMMKQKGNLATHIKTKHLCITPTIEIGPSIGLGPSLGIDPSVTISPSMGIGPSMGISSSMGMSPSIGINSSFGINQSTGIKPTIEYVNGNKQYTFFTDMLPPSNFSKDSSNVEPKIRISNIVSYANF